MFVATATRAHQSALAEQIRNVAGGHDGLVTVMSRILSSGSDDAIEARTAPGVATHPATAARTR